MNYLKFCSLALIGITFTAHSFEVIVKNDLPSERPCLNGNTVKLFYAGQDPNDPPLDVNQSRKITGDFSDEGNGGLGIQINNWYWTKESYPVQSGDSKNPQNPDNSGAQFIFQKDACVLTKKMPPWFGKGIETYVIADVTVSQNSEGCVLTISKNAYTNAVTKDCCAPPLSKFSNICQDGSWGITQSGQQWPPAASSPAATKTQKIKKLPAKNNS